MALLLRRSRASFLRERNELTTTVEYAWPRVSEGRHQRLYRSWSCDSQSREDRNKSFSSLSHYPSARRGFHHPVAVDRRRMASWRKSVEQRVRRDLRNAQV